MSRRKNIQNHLREAIVAAHQFGKGYKVISKLFRVHHSAVKDYSQVENIQDSCQSFPGVDASASSPQGQTVQCSEKLQKKKQQLHLRLYRPQLACYVLKFMTAQLEKD